MNARSRSAARTAAGIFILIWFGMVATPAEEPDADAVIRMIDASVQARFENVLGFTDTEHYAVYRGQDETHPVAEMTVAVTYGKEVGKSYRVLSESGSALVRKFGLHPLLDNEKNINLPGNIKNFWFDSANYEMRLNPGGMQKLDGRDCYVVTVTARRKAPNMIDGKLWVDAGNGFIVRLEGVASKSPSPFAGTTHMMRQYAQTNGFPMATHARAESSSLLFGRTVVVIDYSDYRLDIRRPQPAKPSGS